MKVALIAVGKLKEAYLRGASDEYEKRIGRFAQLEVLELADEPAPEKYSSAQAQQVLAREGERILSKILPRDFVVALAIDGARYTSERFASTLNAWLEDAPRVTFVIGGSLGLSDAVLARSDARVSLSDMTYPHQLARIILLEQIYRAFKINNNQTYHK